jgi:hypothetical protein
MARDHGQILRRFRVFSLSLVVALGFVGAATATAPSNLDRPQLKGRALVRADLVTSRGAWAGTASISYSFGWQRCNVFGSSCLQIASEAQQRLTLRRADIGRRIRSEVTASNTDGDTVARSRHTRIVTPNRTWRGRYPAFQSGALTPGLSIRQTRRGYCWTGSLVTGRSNAWRCFTGNFIRDPCFSDPSDGVPVVVCPRAPTDRRLLRIRLTKPLPWGYGNSGRLSRYPWTIVRRDGVACNFATGATVVVRGKRLNYLCANGSYLWGARRNATHGGGSQ